MVLRNVVHELIPIPLAVRAATTAAATVDVDADVDDVDVDDNDDNDDFCLSELAGGLKRGTRFFPASQNVSFLGMVYLLGPSFPSPF